MGLVPAKCTNCGGKIKVDDAKEAGICEHCGSAFITEKVIKNNVTNYNITNNVTKIINGKETDEAEEKFNKGLVFLGTKAYDKAEKCFEEAINISPSVSKYYFYILVAKVKNFTDLSKIAYFFDAYNERYAESFFKFTTPKECKALSKEFDIDLNNGYDGLVLDIYKKYWGKFDLEYYLEDEIKKVKEDSEAYDYLTDLAKQKLSKIAQVTFYNGHPVIEKQRTENIKKWLEIIIKAGKCPDKSITSLENIDLDYMYRLSADITMSAEEIKAMQEKEKKEQEEIKKEMPLIEKCAKLERKLYHHLVKSVGGVMIVALICGAVGLFFGYFISQTEIASEWEGLSGMFIIMAIFIALGTISPIIGCILKIKQDKLIAQVKNKEKLENELEEVRAQEKAKWNSSSSYGSSSYSSSSYSSSSDTSSSSSSSSSDTSSSSPSSYDIYDINGNKTGSVENKGSGRINDVYDENGVVKGWAVDNGGDTMDYYNSDGSYGGTIDKD